MGQRKKIGPRIDEGVWQAFRNYVEEKHGGTKNVLSHELETALRNHMEPDNGPDQFQVIEDELNRLNQEIREMKADGAGPAPTASDADSTDTHRDGTAVSKDERDGGSDRIQDRPHPKASRHDKIRWLAQQARQTADDQMLPRPKIRKIVQDEYNFSDDRIDQYVEAVIDHLGAEANPMAPTSATLVWGDRLDERREAAEDQERDHVEGKLDAISSGKPRGPEDD